MADGYWSHGCRPDWQYKGYPGLGGYYRRDGGFPEHWVGGGIYQVFAAHHWECVDQDSASLGGPVKDYGWVAEMNYGRGCWGQWFERGAIGYHDGAWRIMYGQYGQGAGLTSDAEPRPDAEIPPEHDELLHPPVF